MGRGKKLGREGRKELSTQISEGLAHWDPSVPNTGLRSGKEGIREQPEWAELGEGRGKGPKRQISDQVDSLRAPPAPSPPSAAST